MPLENLLGQVGDLYCFSDTFRMLVNCSSTSNWSGLIHECKYSEIENHREFLFVVQLSVLNGAFHLRIEVHFFCLHLEMKGHWSRLNLAKREVLLKDLHATSVLSFPYAKKRSVF